MERDPRLKKRKTPSPIRYDSSSESEQEEEEKQCKNIQYDEKEFVKNFNRIDWSLISDDRMFKILSTVHEICDLRIKNGDTDDGTPLPEEEKSPYPGLWLSDSEYSSDEDNANRPPPHKLPKMKTDCKEECQENFGPKITIGNLSFFISKDDDPLCVQLGEIMHRQTTDAKLPIGDMMNDVMKLFDHDTQRYQRALHRIENILSKITNERHLEVSRLMLSLRPVVQTVSIPSTILRDPQTIELAKLIGRSVQSGKRHFSEYGREAMKLFDYDFHRFTRAFKQIKKATHAKYEDHTELVYLSPTRDLFSRSQAPSYTMSPENSIFRNRIPERDPLFSPNSIGKRSIQPPTMSVRQMTDLLEPEDELSLTFQERWMRNRVQGSTGTNNNSSIFDSLEKPTGKFSFRSFIENSSEDKKTETKTVFKTDNQAPGNSSLGHSVSQTGDVMKPGGSSGPGGISGIVRRHMDEHNYGQKSKEKD